MNTKEIKKITERIKKLDNLDTGILIDKHDHVNQSYFINSKLAKDENEFYKRHGYDKNWDAQKQYVENLNRIMKENPKDGVVTIGSIGGDTDYGKLVAAHELGHAYYKKNMLARNVFNLKNNNLWQTLPYIGGALAFSNPILGASLSAIKSFPVLTDEALASLKAKKNLKKLGEQPADGLGKAWVAYLKNEGADTLKKASIGFGSAAIMTKIDNLISQ